MALFPQFPYANLHELNLDWLIENISQLVEDGTVISVNGMSGRVTLYTEKDVELPPRAFDANWSVYRRIADKMAGIQFTGEKFFYITKNVNDEDFTIQEVFTSANPPPYPVTSVNGRIGTVIIAGDNTPYNMDGVDTIESVVSNIQKAIGPVVQYTSCSVGVTAGQYVYLFMSGISGRSDGIYKTANNKSANTAWTAADLIPVSAGVGGVLADIENSMQTIDISNNLTFTWAKGNISNVLAYKTGKMISLAFVITTTEEIAASAAFQISVAFSSDALKPIIRQPGSSNSILLNSINISPISTGADCVVRSNSIIPQGFQTWICYTYMCNG